MGFLWRYKWTWTEIEKVDMAELERFVLTYLADDGIWRLRRENDGAKLYTSVIQPYGTQYVRRILEVPAGLEQVRGFLVDEFTTPVYSDALVGDGDGSGDGAGLIDLTPKPGAEEPFIPPVPEEE